MFDKEIIERICNLTFTQEDLEGSQYKIKYDIEYPFEKYYKTETITEAIQKCIDGKWNLNTLCSWFCSYNHIIGGGFTKEVKENFSPFEALVFEAISWDLDGYSMLHPTLFKERPNYLFEIKEGLKNLGHIWDTRNDWKCFYSMIGKDAKANKDYDVVFMNEKSKEYMIVCTGFFEGEYSDDRTHFIKDKEFINLIQQLEKENYSLLHHSEEFYYEDVKR